jgi:hypothetical protein
LGGWVVLEFFDGGCEIVVEVWRYVICVNLGSARMLSVRVDLVRGIVSIRFTIFEVLNRTFRD